MRTAYDAEGSLREQELFDRDGRRLERLRKAPGGFLEREVLRYAPDGPRARALYTEGILWQHEWWRYDASGRLTGRANVHAPLSGCPVTHYIVPRYEPSGRIASEGILSLNVLESRCERVHRYGPHGVTERTTFGGCMYGGEPPSERFEYREDGALRRHLEWNSAQRTREFDGEGRLVLDRNQFMMGGGTTQTWTYEEGRLVRGELLTEWERGSSRRAESLGYDGDGRLVERSVAYASAAAGAELPAPSPQSRCTFAYDAQGNLRSEECDLNLDGTPDAWLILKRDESGNLLEEQRTGELQGAAARTVFTYRCDFEAGD